ncbi:MAG: ankyrin repeat domain-containing protein [Bacteroidota bacterium]
MKAKALLLLVLLWALTSHAQSIYRTACRGNLARLDSLLASTDINTQDQRGRSLLHWAVGCNKNDVFEYLVEKGITTDLEDNEGATPLYMTVRFQNMELFKRLVELLPDTRWKEKYGGSLFEKAILNRDLTFVQKLTETGIPLNMTNKRGSIPLEIALRIEADSIADWLKDNGANAKLVRNFQAEGPYLGQEPPGNTAKVFAPNFISTEEYEFGSVFNKAGDEFYYGVDLGGRNVIRFSKLEGNLWSKPKAILSHERYGYNDPFLSPDENRLYFISNRALEGKGEPKDIDIWYVERKNDGWSQPINAGPNINSKSEEYYISFTKDGTLYFASDKNQSHHDIYTSKFMDGEFQEAAKLGDAINSEAYEADVFVDPNGEYLIFCAQRDDGFGRGDLYISFKEENGAWSPSINMGETVNTEGHELCPFVTADGNYLLFTSRQDIYWISTDIIAALKSK